ncbi:putative sporulation protein YtxC [Clostridium cylindrosporum]|uniref:Sporulation protein YtxC n=1 Tax=Clostridium cylindrosporum DSM 605 TaxID=1121307 RepID=A0A0J8DEK5_CLOCY|nr:putative sporulation protein YtxC [Clostridium cylindrosporum]KMT22669.1 sporulation protein YtxC [Clostridium cylindrosporum DSM 605]
MLLLLSIGYTNTRNDMYYKFTQLCSYLKEKRVDAAIVESAVGQVNYIKCILKDTEENITFFNECKEFFYAYASNIIYEFISSEYEEKIIKKIVKDSYYYLENKEKTEIIKRCNSLMSGSGTFIAGGLISSISCKNSVIKKIQDYLDNNQEINIEGFVRFRLKNIMSELNVIVDKVVEDYVLEREYSEFIKLLKYFVDIQESKYEIVNIFIKDDSKYQITNEDDLDITDEFFEDFGLDTSGNMSHREDILISALITSSPLKIVIHGFENINFKESIDTLINIFGDRMILCSGCDKCKELVGLFM